MPILTWPSKTPPAQVNASLRLDSLVFPQHQAGAVFPTSYSADAQTIPPTNLLIQGDNLAVMSALLPEYAGRIDLIYADPPFFSNRHYRARVGRGEDSRKPQEWQLAEGYPDSWPTLDAYLDMLYPRLALMHRLLAPTGTLYLHLDWHASAYARVLLDEIFGPERLLNEIVWVYHGPSPIRSAFNRKHDTILVYTKSPEYVFNVDAVRQPYDPATVKTFAASPKAGFGKIPDLERGKVPEDWWYFPVVARLHRERTGYPTQKPEALLERILLASSNPGALAADFFCGSGTFPAVAARLGRRFIASDVIWRAVHTTRTRLLDAAAAPFALLGLEGSTLPAAAAPATAPAAAQPGPGRPVFKLQPSHLPGDLDYWEIGLCPEGGIFHSLAQAGRSRKDIGLAETLTLPIDPGNQPVFGRFVCLSGEQFFTPLT